MTASKFWTLITLLLVAAIVISGIFIWTRYSESRPVEISLSSGQEFQGEICIAGAVNNPGFYPLTAEDSLADIIQAAGGTTSNADLSQIKLNIPETGKEYEPQKIDINRAEVWLLKALPGIRDVRAEAIVNYRGQNGHFRNINELIKVEGIGPTTYENIKHLVTVAE